jgi:hypothetical protein
LAALLFCSLEVAASIGEGEGRREGGGLAKEAGQGVCLGCRRRAVVPAVALERAAVSDRVPSRADTLPCLLPCHYDFATRIFRSLWVDAQLPAFVADAHEGDALFSFDAVALALEEAYCVMENRANLELGVWYDYLVAATKLAVGKPSAAPAVDKPPLRELSDALRSKLDGMLEEMGKCERQLFGLGEHC